MAQGNSGRMSREGLRISSVEVDGWCEADGRVPSVGEYVYCTDGPAEVVRVFGRTSDGSRLLELRCIDRPQSFFASSSNVLLRSVTSEAR